MEIILSKTKNKKQEESDFSSLIGKRELSGVQFVDGKLISRKYKYCQAVLFILDDVVYAAIENPDDGYRSYLEKILVIDDEIVISQITNRFTPQKVQVTYIEELGYSGQRVLYFDSVNNAKRLEVLIIGTMWDDNYYPYCVMNFYPENMEVNQNEGI